MISDSQSLSLPRNVQLPRVTFRRPTEIHAADVWELIAKCPQLDRNSLYCELLLSSDFADTRVAAERAGAVVGWLSAYRRPSDPSTLLIAISPIVRSINPAGIPAGLPINVQMRKQR
ncbi:MAG: hypothetical protein EOR73_13975 [Mesorhizobium sp.]|nr:MAG: hypothetical protein EOR73_13975 [Mesorhizobium sp.]